MGGIGCFGVGSLFEIPWEKLLLLDWDGMVGQRSRDYTAMQLSLLLSLVSSANFSMGSEGSKLLKLLFAVGGRRGIRIRASQDCLGKVRRPRRQ